MQMSEWKDLWDEQKYVHVSAECNRTSVLFLLKVLNMYGELIMESADHKVTLNAM